MSASPPPTRMDVRASQILRTRKIWLIPVLIAAVFVALMSVIYFGSVVNPTGHLHSLPVRVVNEDTGATAHGQKVDVGAGLVSALERSKEITSRLELRNATLGQVEPLRQVLEGTRAIMYFGALGDAGLTHSLILIACELVFWGLVGLAVTSWYDHKRLYRIAPDLFASSSRAIDQTLQERADAGPAPASGAQDA